MQNIVYNILQRLPPSLQISPDSANGIVMQHLEKMDSLPKQCMLLHVQGLQNTEIAQLLGISNSYVGKLLKQTAKTIREELDSILEQLR